MRESQSGTAFQADKGSEAYLSEGILSFVEYAPRLLIVLPSRQFLSCKEQQVEFLPCASAPFPIHGGRVGVRGLLFRRYLPINNREHGDNHDERADTSCEDGYAYRHPE